MSYTPFKMQPKGSIAAKMLSKNQKAKLPMNVKKAMVEKGGYEGPLNKKGKSPYEFEKDPKEFANRKNKPMGPHNKNIVYKDGKKFYKAKDGSLHTGQVSDYEAEQDFVPAYPGADISEAEYKKRIKSGSTKRD